MQPLMDRRFESVTSLGTCHRLYRGRVAYRVIAVLVGGLMLIPLVFHLLQPAAEASGGSADIAFSVIGAPTAFWLIWRRCSDTVGVFDQGLALAGRGGLFGGMLEVRWPEIRSLREGPVVLSTHSSEAENQTVTQLLLETTSGRRVEMLGLVDIEQLWADIGRGMARNLLRGQVHEVEAGRDLEFGSFLVSARGLTWRRKGQEKTVEWEQLRSVRVDPEGSSRYPSVSVVGRGPQAREQPWASVTRAQIPSAHLFIALCNHFIDAGRRGGDAA